MGSGQQRVGVARELMSVDELSTWFRAKQAEFVELRTKGCTLHERHVNLRYRPGEPDSSRVTEFAILRAAAAALKIRGDELAESGWTRRIETDFPSLREALAKQEPFRTWSRIGRREEALEYRLRAVADHGEVASLLELLLRCARARRWIRADG